MYGIVASDVNTSYEVHENIEEPKTPYDLFSIFVFIPSTVSQYYFYLS